MERFHPFPVKRIISSPHCRGWRSYGIHNRHRRMTSVIGNSPLFCTCCELISGPPTAPNFVYWINDYEAKLAPNLNYPRTAWPPRGLFEVLLPCGVGRSREYRAGCAILLLAGQRPRCRSRTDRVIERQWPLHSDHHRQ